MNRSLSSKMTSTSVPSNGDRELIFRFVEDLYRAIKSGKWDFVVNEYEKKFKWVHNDVLIKILGGTVLHLAVSDGVENIVEKLITIICKEDEQKKALKIKIKQGNTPLHVAASTGSLRMCICIAKADSTLGNERNKEGESPLFLAALLGRTDIFLCLHYICKSKLYDSYYRKNGGETILHGAIKRECWDLAYRILDQEQQLATFMDERGISPLRLLADKPSAFKSGCRLGWWSSIIYYCIAVDVPKRIDPGRLIERCTEEEKTHKQSRLTMIRVGKKADEENPEGSNVSPKSRHEGSLAESEDHKQYSFWKYCWAPFMIIALVINAILRILGFGEIEKIKETHILSNLVMKTVIRSTIQGMYFDRGTNPLLITEYIAASLVIDHEESWKDFQQQPNDEAPILHAAKNGILEMVESIIIYFPMAIHEETSEGKNMVLLAAEYGQTQVYKLFRKTNLRKESMFKKLDKKGNSALHLAAKLGEHQSRLIAGAALQMQWEIKWYEFVESDMPRYILCQTNDDNKTPADIFTENHKNLVKEGGQWLNKTSESCSVVAALITTVAYATSTTVPGGVKENSGTPILESHPAFEIFAVSSLVALCFSVTALFFFLSILTSRYQEKDFRIDLPRKLLLGLTSLFVSIAAMLISFCAGHFFVLKDKLKNRALPVYVVTCIPITFYAILQFPLYVDLVRAHFKKVPQPSHMMVPL